MMRQPFPALARLVLAGLVVCGCTSDEPSTPPCGSGLTSWVSGRVVDAQGGVPARIVAEPSGDLPAPPPTQTDESGAFILVLRPGRYSIAVYPTGSGRFYCGPSADPFFPGVLDLSAPGTNKYLDLVCGTWKIETISDGLYTDTGVRFEVVSRDHHYRFRSGLITQSGTHELLLRGMPPRQYGLSLIVGDGSARRYVQPETLETALNVLPGRLSETRRVLAPPGRLAGSVRGSWQSLPYPDPLPADPSVEVWDVDSVRIAETPCTSDGDFLLGVFRPATVKLRVNLRGISRWIGGTAWRDATEFTIRSGDHVIVPDVLESGILCRLHADGLGPAYTASVKVVDRDGEPVVEPLSYPGYSGNLIGISNLIPGQYYVHVRPVASLPSYGHVEWEPQWYDGADSLSRATPIVITRGGEIQVVDIALTGLGSIRGTLTRVDGSAAGGYSVSAIRLETGSDSTGTGFSSEQTTHHGDGSFHIPGLVDGDYAIVVTRWLPGSHLGVRWWYPGVSSFLQAEMVRVRSHQPVDLINWSLPD